jgi:hypothetical protein
LVIVHRRGAKNAEIEFYWSDVLRRKNQSKPSAFGRKSAIKVDFYLKLFLD